MHDSVGALPNRERVRIRGMRGSTGALSNREAGFGVVERVATSGHTPYPCLVTGGEN
jgi:hypothetical protein